MEHIRNCDYVVNCHGTVSALAFSPFEWCDSLLAVGTSARITIFSLKFPEDSNLGDLEYDVIRDFHHGTRVTALAWSPQSSVVGIPKTIRFASAGADFNVRILTSDLKDNDNVQTLMGHESYINDIAFDPHSGNSLASVSDDFTCFIWNLDGTLKAEITLTSPGMSVRWHREEPGKLMVAEKKGIIRFYNAATQQPVMFLDCKSPSVFPLMAADWSSKNSLVVCCAANTDWIVWDTSVSSQPLEQRLAHSEGNLLIKFSNSSQNMFATFGFPGNEVKVHNPKVTKELMNGSVMAGWGLTWHCKLPVLAVGGDKKVHLWNVENI